mgnify:CR=1 FL=1
MAVANIAEMSIGVVQATASPTDTLSGPIPRDGQAWDRPTGSDVQLDLGCARSTHARTLVGHPPWAPRL